jgi:hypothetical protein
MGDAAGLEDDSDQPGGDYGSPNDGLGSGESNGVHVMDTIVVTASIEEELEEGRSDAVAVPVAPPFSWESLKRSAIRNYTAGFTAHYQSLKALLGLLALHNAMQEEEEEEKQDALEVDDARDAQKRPSTPGKMQNEVKKGRAPKDVERVDRGHVPEQEPHVHYKDGTSSTQSGKIHDKHKGTPSPSRKTNGWLENHGWTPFGSNSN